MLYFLCLRFVKGLELGWHAWLGCIVAHIKSSYSPSRDCGVENLKLHCFVSNGTML